VPAEIRLPFSRFPARQVSPQTWRKRVLPVGKIVYQDRVLNFDKEYLQGLADSFSKRAYDQVPFQLADARNTHTNDPERTRGWITDVSVQDDGLWITAQTTPDGNKVLMSNPQLGVSARIVEDYARADGQYFPAAIQHVLGTLDPRIPGLGAWEAVQLSSVPSDMVIDLSAAEFAGEEGGSIMPDLDPEQQGKLARLLELDPDRLSALMDGLADIEAASGGEGGSNVGYDEYSDLDSDEALIAAINEMSDDDFAEVAAEFDMEPELVFEPEPELAGAGAALSNDGYGMDSIELANYQLAETQRQMSVLQRDHDRQAFENEKRKLLNLGVPMLITELARPLLEGTGHVVELSNGHSTDAGLIMRKVLTEFGKQASMLDMTGELGSSMDEPDTSQRAEEARSSMVSLIRNQTGL
jgi:hypothetical protein